jgi:hypothetical protein
MTDGGDNHNGTSPRTNPASPADRTFDPRPVVERLRLGGLQTQQEVDLLVLWMRKEHPQARILTDLAQFDTAMAVIKATITLPSGAEATSYGSALAADGDEMVERAETKAIGRALNVLGYSVESFDGRPVATERQASTTKPAASPRPAPTPSPAREEVIEIDVVEPEPAPTPAATSPVVAALPEDDEEIEVDPADYSWTAFWRWARPHGFDNRGAVEAFLGQSINGLNPGDVRRLIREHDNA